MIGHGNLAFDAFDNRIVANERVLEH